MAKRLDTIRQLYEGHDDRAHRFRYWLLAFDLATILFVIVTSFVERNPVIMALDVIFGLFILTDFAARFAIQPRKLRYLTFPTTWADIVAVLSFLAPLATDEAFAFLRVLRTLRLLHTYQLLRRLRDDFPFFRRNEEVALAAINLMVFLFIMTGLIYATQHRTNADIGNYVDALYFTVTSLTTTGYGDIILEGTSGRLLSVLVMIVGVGLFLRLAQVLFRPTKVRHTCPECGLFLHDIDAVHCKHCGEALKIKTEGVV